VYAGQETAVIVHCGRGDDDDGGGGSGGGGDGGKSGGGVGESGSKSTPPPSILRCLAPHPARVSSLTFAPVPLHPAQDDEKGDGSGPTTTTSSSSGGGGASAEEAPPPSTPPMLLVCGCEDGTAVCWDVSRGVRTRSARRYRSELSAVAIVSLEGAAEAGAPPSPRSPPPALPLAIFGDSAGRLLAWSYREGERSKPDPLAARLPDHGGIVCLAAAPPQQQHQKLQLLYVGCRDGTVACVELGPVDGGGGEAPCASSVRYVFSPHERAGGGRAAAARTTTAAAAAEGAARPGASRSAAASAAASPISDATVQALDCVAVGSGDANCLLLLTGTAAGGLALWDVWADQCSAVVGAATPSSPPQRLAHAFLQRPSGGGGQGGGKQVPWTAARVVPGSFRAEEDGVASCVVAASAHGGALLLQRLAWQAASGNEPSLQHPSVATRHVVLTRTRASHARPVFGVCFPAGRARTMATISMDRSVVLSRLHVAAAAAAAAAEVAGGVGTTGEGRGTAAAAAAPAASQQSSSIRPFWSTQGLGGYAYAMDARLGVLAIACGDRSLRLVRLLSRRQGTADAADAIEGEPLEIVWAGGTSKLLCCAWSPTAGSVGLLAWGDADGRVGVLASAAAGPKRGGGSSGPNPSSFSRLVPFAAARHGGPALQLSWSPEFPAPCLYSLGGEGCLLRWPAAAAAVDSAEPPLPPLDVAPALHAAVRSSSSSAAALSSTPEAAFARRQWTAVAWHPTLPLLAAGADDGAVAVFSASRPEGAEGEAAAAANDDDEDGGASPAPAWRVVGFYAPPGSSTSRVRRVCWAAPPSPADGSEGDGRPPLLAAVGARQVLVLRVAAAAPDGSPAADQRMPLAAVCVASGAEGVGGSGEDAMDAAWWLPGRGGSKEAGGDGDDDDKDDDDPNPLLVVGLANGGLRAWRVRPSPSSSAALPLQVPAAAADAGGGEPSPPLLPPHAGAVQCLLPVALDGKAWLLSGSRDQSVRAWRARDLVPGVGQATGGEGEATVAVVAAAAPRAAAAAAPLPALGGSATTSQRNWRRLLPAGNKQAMPEPPFSRTPEERAACLAAVLALAREVLPLPGEEEEEEEQGERGGEAAVATARLLALMVADADAVAADPELQQGMSAERRAALALWRGDARTALGGGSGSSLGAEAALLAAGAGGAAAWRAATAAAAVSAEAAGQPVVAALLRRIAAEGDEEGVTDLVEDDDEAQNGG
jgi:hypothetical protein